MEPSHEQREIARRLAEGDPHKLHFTSTGILVLEYPWGELEGVTSDLRVIFDKEVTE